jgi:tyrosyl-tRNA synthetase
MKKIITDKNKIEEILTRGVENAYPSKQALKDILLSGKKIRIYCGYDPTAKSLHIGNAISINKLGQFQKLGHEIIFLVGDFTGMIGDPTDKEVIRKKLTREEVLENSKNYKKQASGYLKFNGENPAKIKYNSEWNDKLTFKNLIELSSNFTVQQILNRDMFNKRIKEEKPIYLHEFLYPLAQGYDSVAMDVDLEIGGNDQTFNMLCGRDLMKSIKGKEKFVITLKLLADESGKKMGKTEGNAVNLDEIPENMFGQIMAWPDGLISPGFELCTNIAMEEVKKINPKENPRDAKLRLAFEITKINHGEKAAKKAQEYFINTFSKKKMPEDMPEINVVGIIKNIIKVKGGLKISIIKLLLGAKLATSLSDARRKIEQGGVSIEGEKVIDWKTEINNKYHGKRLKVGRHFVKIKFQ